MQDPTCGLSSGTVVFSQFFWPAALKQLTGLLADGSWVPMVTMHFAAVTAALLAGWIAVRAKASALSDRQCLLAIR